MTLGCSEAALSSGAMLYSVIPTPLGDLLALTTGDALTALAFDAEPPPEATRDDDALSEVRAQLGAYFEGSRAAFDLPLAPEACRLGRPATPFQRAVWDHLLTIPHGETRSYGDLARALGQPLAAQAVGAANGQNPLAIVVPCHRVVGADGSLTGYAGGLHRKRALLDLESPQGSLF
ncbi:MAG: methylated-DNA--[protein]-cysteine S-methyltransferase [Bacteroidota bacterium]